MSNWKQPSETIPYSKYLVLLKGVENIVICTCLLILWTFCQFASLFMYTPVMNFKKRHYYQALYLKQVREYRANPLYWLCIVCHKQLLTMIGHSLLRFIAVSVVLHVYKCVRTDQLCLFYLPKFTVTTGPYLSLHFGFRCLRVLSFCLFNHARLYCVDDIPIRYNTGYSYSYSPNITNI